MGRGSEEGGEGGERRGDVAGRRKVWLIGSYTQIKNSY